MKVFCQCTGVGRGKMRKEWSLPTLVTKIMANDLWHLIWNSDFPRPRKTARDLSTRLIWVSLRGSKRAHYLTEVSVCLRQMANQNASSGEGVPADDNTAWIDPWIENEPDPRNDVVTKVTMRHAQVMWISRARHGCVVCSSPVKFSVWNFP